MALVATWVGARLVRRSMAVTAAAAGFQVAAAVARHEARTGALPDGYDSLIEAPSTVLTSIPEAARRQLRPKEMDDADRRVLRAHGITTTWMHVPGGASWAGLAGGKALGVAAGGLASDDVVTLDTRRVDPDALLGPGVARGTPHEAFLVLGIGTRCTLVGPAAELADAPVLGAAARSLHPSAAYRRLALVVRLDRDAARPVLWLGVVSFGESGIETLGVMLGGAAWPSGRGATSPGSGW